MAFPFLPAVLAFGLGGLARWIWPTAGISVREGAPVAHANLNIDFELRAQKPWMQALLTWFGSAREQRSGERSFDEQIFMGSDDRRLGLAFSQSPRARVLANSLLAMPRARAVRCSENLIWIEHSSPMGKQAARQFRAQMAERCAPMLSELAHELARAQPRLAREALDPSRSRHRLLSALQAGWGLALGAQAVTAIAWERDQNWLLSWPDAHHLALATLIHTLAWLLIALVFMRASSRLPFALAGALTLGLLGSLGAAPVAIYYINDRLSPAPGAMSAQMGVNLTREIKRGSKGKVKHYLALRSLTPSERARRLSEPEAHPTPEGLISGAGLPWIRVSALKGSMFMSNAGFARYEIGGLGYPILRFALPCEPEPNLLPAPFDRYEGELETLIGDPSLGFGPSGVVRCASSP